MASFWYTFSAWFFHKNVLCLILYQWTVSISHLIFSQDIKQNVLLSLIQTVGDVINFNIFLESTSKAMADREKRGEDEYTKTWISRERKELFRWNKKHFSQFLNGLSFGEKIKIWKK